MKKESPRETSTEIEKMLNLAHFKIKSIYNCDSIIYININ